MENPMDQVFPTSESQTEHAEIKIDEKADSAFADFDLSHEYSDEFYESYIAAFVPSTKRRLFYRFVKRSFDIIASLLGLIVLSPLFLVIAIAIKVDSKGPVIFSQGRMGKGGKEFTCYKFRSMLLTAPKDRPTSQLEDPEKYLTRVGRFLRRFSLDELPQLVCCLLGTMSLVGPRPLVLAEKKCNDMRMRMNVYSMRPGITGYAQVSGRDDVNYRNKAIMDALYVKNASIGFDLKILFKTVGVVLSRKGNDSEKIEKKENK